MLLQPKQQKHLRELSHRLKPVVIIGQHGVTDNVMAEINNALEYHELIKVRVNAGDRESRTAMIKHILGQSNSQLVQHIGHIIALYKRNHKKPKITLPGD